MAAPFRSGAWSLVGRCATSCGPQVAIPLRHLSCTRLPESPWDMAQHMHGRMHAAALKSLKKRGPPTCRTCGFWSSFRISGCDMSFWNSSLGLRPMRFALLTVSSMCWGVMRSSTWVGILKPWVCRVRVWWQCRSAADHAGPGEVRREILARNMTTAQRKAH